MSAAVNDKRSDASNIDGPGQAHQVSVADLVAKAKALAAAWYPRLTKPVQVNVIGDYAGQDLGVVDGDAVVEWLLNETTKDDPSRDDVGLHPLRCTHALERFFKQLQDTRCNFVIAFFDDRCTLPLLDALTSGQHDLAFASRAFVRAAAVRHLFDTRAETGLTVLQFPSIDSDAWADFANTQRPRFVLTHDGLRSIRTHAFQLVSVAQTLFLHKCMGGNGAFKPLAVVLMSRDMFQSQHLVAFVCETGASLQAVAKEQGSNYDALGNDLAALVHNAIHSRLSSPPDFESLVLPDDADAVDMAIGDRLAVSVFKQHPNLVSQHKLLAAAFVLHLALLPCLHLDLRAFKLQATRTNPVTRRFLADFYLAASPQLDTLSEHAGSGRFADCFDPALFAFLAVKTNFTSALAALDDTTRNHYSYLCEQCGIPSSSTVTPTTRRQQRAKIAPTRAFGAECSVGLTAYNHPIISAYLPDLPINNLDDNTDDNNLDLREVTHLEQTHWHSKSLLAEINKRAKVVLKGPRDANGRVLAKFASRAYRSDQKQAHWIAVYAASLTGASGMILEPRTIVVGKPQYANAKATQAAPATWQAPAKVAKKKTLSKADAIRADNIARLASAQEKLAQERLAFVIEDLKITPPITRLDAKSDDVAGIIAEKKRQLASFSKHFTEFNRKFSAGTNAKMDMQVLRLRLAIEGWYASCKAQNRDPEFAVAAFKECVDLIKTVVGMDPETREPVATTVATVCQQALAVLGLSSFMADELRSILGDGKGNAAADGEKPSKSSKKSDKKSDKKADKKGDKKASTADQQQPAETHVFPFKVSFPKASSRTAIGTTAVDFQLEHYGEHMERMLDSRPDQRVDFEPDSWQCDVLDCIDRKDSVLVVAPTSAGKTFCSYYAMEQCLREGDDGVVVYIAPTKALVNQVAAEVEARFSKSYSFAGKSVWAILTRDYRIHNPLNCQILVTVPEMLQILMLQTNVAGEWVPRIKRIIFDEIHSIGQLDGGVVWEQLLVMNPSPILALSATVGNVDEFGQWLINMQASHGRTMSIVQHKTRYSDLRKFVYVPQIAGKGKSAADRSKSPESAAVFRHVHPFSAFSLSHGKLVDDLELEPRDMLILAREMRELAGDGLDAPTDPNDFFAAETVIRRADTNKYQEHLRDVFKSWMDHPDSHSPDSLFSRLMVRLSGSSAADLQKLDEVLPYDTTSEEYWLYNVSELLRDLDSQKMLPGLFFCYDRHMNDMLLEQALEALEDEEKAFKETDPVWKAKFNRWTQWKAMARARQDALAKEIKAAGNKGAEEMKRSGGMETSSEFDSFDPDAPLPQFSYANQTCGVTLGDIAEEMKKQTGIPEFAYRAMQRGMGVHHAGMSGGYKQLCERWFRKGWLRVVFCTGTLAMGINMPAKTSAFIGDSVYLTALNYRQAAGRAGRRGFDSRGNVVFYGMTMDKVYRLLTSKLPDLLATFPISTTLVLRLHSLLRDARGKDVAKSMIQGLLSANRLVTTNKEASSATDLHAAAVTSAVAQAEQVPHFFRASVEYLRTFGLLSADGVPVDLAGLVGHLYFYEPANLAFAKLVRSGVLYDLCADFEARRSETAEQLVCVLSHMFARRRLATAEASSPHVLSSPSRVVLDPLPASLAGELKKHARQAVDVYTRYALAHAASADHGPDTLLPLSGRHAGATESAEAVGDVLAPSLLKTKARSSFVALAGFDDAFKTVHELANSLRPGLVLEASAIPSFDGFVSETEILNSYALDFYKHGQQDALIHGNRIRAGDVWRLLNEFWLVLLSVRTSVEVLLMSIAQVEAGDEDEDESSGADHATTAPSEQTRVHDTDLVTDEDMDSTEPVQFRTHTGKPALTVQPFIKIDPALRNPKLWLLYRVIKYVQLQYGQFFVRTFA
ncbi:hypothetical protein BC831DRAFT_511078 [Entophlyctis helioformis]|nr:hypothetical protein BC831DRAFT_511078 [Entophlyctis helioformis]